MVQHTTQTQRGTPLRYPLLSSYASPLVIVREVNKFNSIPNIVRRVSINIRLPSQEIHESPLSSVWKSRINRFEREQRLRGRVDLVSCVQPERTDRLDKPNNGLLILVDCFNTVLLVVYAHEIESMRRGGLACCRPIPSPQDIREAVG